MAIQYRLLFDSVIKNITFGAVSLGFVSWVGQIGHRVAAKGSPQLRHFSKLGVQEIRPVTRYKSRLNTASIMRV